MIHYNLKPLLPSDIIVTSESISPTHVKELLPQEATLIQHAAEKRRLEFATGRLCVRQALAQLGIHNFPLIAGKDRCPIWPKDIRGSISHASTSCIVAIRRSDLNKSIGIDMEIRRSVDPELWHLVLLPDEKKWINAQNKIDHADAATLIFSAKESAYKYQYLITRKYMDFHDMYVQIDLDGFAFSVSYKSTCIAALIEWKTTGRFTFLPDVLLTCLF